eukprot:scaffold8461_cov267-Pinguiococcus_pyrenoidosus.AAC.2
MPIAIARGGVLLGGAIGRGILLLGGMNVDAGHLRLAKLLQRLLGRSLSRSLGLSRSRGSRIALLLEGAEGAQDGRHLVGHRVVAGQRAGQLGLPLQGRARDLLALHVEAGHRADRHLLLDGVHVLVELVDERDAVGHVHAGDVLFADPIDVLHEPPKRVGVRGHQHVLPVRQVALDLLVPEGHRPPHGVQERLGERDVLLLQVAVLPLQARPVRVRPVQRRRSHLEGPSPGLHGGLSVLPGGLRLAEAGEGAVHPLVQAVVLDDGQVHQAQLAQQNPSGADGALEHRRVGDVDGVAALQQQPSRAGDLSLAQLGQVGVRPAGEGVVGVPRGLSVAHEDERARLLPPRGPVEARELPGRLKRQIVLAGRARPEQRLADVRAAEGQQRVAETQPHHGATRQLAHPKRKRDNEPLARAPRGRFGRGETSARQS